MLFVCVLYGLEAMNTRIANEHNEALKRIQEDARVKIEQEHTKQYALLEKMNHCPAL